MSEKKYFDLHCHPSFKSFLADPAKKMSCWDNINYLLTDMLRSQSSLSQVVIGNISTFVASIITLEDAFTESCLIEHILGTLGPIDVNKLKDRSGYKNLDFLKDEIAHLQKSISYPPKNILPIKIINQKDDLIDKQINIILSLEGAHSLEKEGFTLSQSLNELRQMYRVFYLTLVHMTRYNTSNHSYSIKKLKNVSFHPTSIGLTTEGKELIQTAYSGDKPTFIDIKHMSLCARLDFYTFKKEKFPEIPILSTHSGVTGIRYDRLPNLDILTKKVKHGSILVQYNEKPEGLKIPKTGKICSFYPCSINLYDEEIIEIINSKGLIGIMLDKRPLGLKSSKEEYFSEQEFKKIFGQLKIFDAGAFAFSATHSQLEEESKELEAEELEEDMYRRAPRKRPNYKFHIWSVANQIIHIIGTYYQFKKEEIDPWKHICIGSDYDGLVSPPDCCFTHEEFKDLEEGLVEIFPEVLKSAATQKDRYKEAIKFNFGVKEEDPYKTIDYRIRGLMYDNGHQFILQHI